MSPTRLYARETVEDAELVYLNVYLPHVRKPVPKRDKYVKHLAHILDYSLSGMRIKTSAYLFPNQRVDLLFKNPDQLLPAEIVGIRRRNGLTFEYGVKLLLNQHVYHSRGMYESHPIRRFHLFRMKKKGS